MKMINYEKQHRKLWNWLAEHPEKRKDDYFEGWPEECIPSGMCFACEEAQERLVDFTSVVFDPCELCPLGGLDVMGCFGPTGHYKQNWYQKWRSIKSPERRAELARKIAELPWKEATGC